MKYLKAFWKTFGFKPYTRDLIREQITVSSLTCIISFVVCLGVLMIVPIKILNFILYAMLFITICAFLVLCFISIQKWLKDKIRQFKSYL